MKFSGKILTLQRQAAVTAAEGGVNSKFKLREDKNWRSHFR